MKIYKPLIAALLISLGAQAQQYIDTPEFVQPVIAAGITGSHHFNIAWNKLVFTGGDPAVNGSEWWMYDGTNATAGPELYPGKPSGIKVNYAYPNSFSVVYKNKIYYSGVDPTHGNEPFVWDGTSNTPQLLSDIMPGSGSSSPRNFAVSDDNLFFIAKSSSLYQLYVYNIVTKQLTFLSIPNYHVGGNELICGHNGKFYYSYKGMSEYDPVSKVSKVISATTGGFSDCVSYGSSIYLAHNGGFLHKYDGSGYTQSISASSGLYDEREPYTHCIYPYDGKIYFWQEDLNNKIYLSAYDTLTATVAHVSKYVPMPDTAARTRRLGFLIIDKNNVYYKHGSQLVWFNGNKRHTVLPLEFHPRTAVVYKNDVYVNCYMDSKYYMMRLKDTLVSLSVQNVTFDADVNLYPNPTTNNTNISLSLNNATSVGVTITDVIGKAIVQIPPQRYTEGENNIPIQTSKLPTGTYIVNLKGKDGALLWSGKLLKQ